MRAHEWGLSIIRRDGTALVPRRATARSDWDITRKVVAGGRVTSPDELGGLLGARVLRYVVTEKDGRVDLPWGVVTAADPHYTDTGVTWTVEWMDDAARADRQRLLTAVGLASTTAAVPRVRSRLAEIGIVAMIADNSATLRTARSFTATQTRLDEANALLEAVGWHPLWPSPTGLVSGPHINPATAPIAHTFREGDEALHLPDYPQEQDFLSIPNRLQLTSKGDGKAATIAAIARDVATSQWSYEARGDWVDADPQTSDAVTQTALVAEADRRLKALQMNAVTMTIQHIWTPKIQPGSVVNIVAARPEVSGRWQAVSSQIDEVAVGALASTKVRRVVR